ncbi:MAG: flagellar basal body-associated FliL family protein [Candidatus Polarisedimenticolaceae bacterium]|nr:flagellar basal body-associated FliL family protein [Candidatus Polarisedimenticolaceae bacterium]
MRSTVFLPLLFLMLFSPSLFAGDDEEENEELKTALYYELAPSFVVNLNKGGNYIRCDIQLMTRDDESYEMIKLHSPALRHHLLLLLTEQDGKKLKSAKGKESLRKKALSTANKALKEIVKGTKIEALFFTTFFVQ